MSQRAAAFKIGTALMTIFLSEDSKNDVSVDFSRHLSKQEVTLRVLAKQLGLDFDLDKIRVGGFEKIHYFAEEIRYQLAVHSVHAAWSFSLGMDLIALSVGRNIGIARGEIGILRDKLRQECDEASIPFRLVEQLIKDASDTTLDKFKFLNLVLNTIDNIEKYLENPIGSDVFLVHGHDEALKETVARFLEKSGLSVTILHEKPNLGRTIIKKFEDYSDVGYAIILLTPDDVGRSISSSADLPRARQNVIFELGFFVGKLGGQRVCALYVEGVEIPSDYSGVLYVKVDHGGVWRMQLAREMKAAGLPVDLNRAAGV